MKLHVSRDQVTVLLSEFLPSPDTETTNKLHAPIATYPSCRCFSDHVPKGKGFIKEGTCPVEHSRRL